MAEWLTLDELAAYLKRGRSTIYKMARQGGIPATKIGREWRFDREAIDNWLREQSPSQQPASKRQPRKSRRKAR